MEQSEIPKDANFIVFEKTDRHGKWSVEKFPGVRHKRFEKAAKLLIAGVFEKIHPIIRNSTVVIQFVDKVIIAEELEGGSSVGAVGGAGNLSKFTYYPSETEKMFFSIAISKERLAKLARKNPKTEYLWALQIMFHELFEMDYWKRSEDLKLNPPKGDFNSKEYINFEHERIADRRAAKHMADTLGGTFRIRRNGGFDLKLPKW